MQTVLNAIEFQAQAHKGQIRRASGAPYASHPLAVSYILASVKESKKLDELLIAALLHDTLEDTDVTAADIESRFGPMVRSIVEELTNDPTQIAALGKLEYHKKKLLELTSYALVIKLADRYANILDNPSIKMVEDTLELMHHLLANRKLSKSQAVLVNRIILKCNQLKP